MFGLLKQYQAIKKEKSVSPITHPLAIKVISFSLKCRPRMSGIFLNLWSGGFEVSFKRLKISECSLGGYFNGFDNSVSLLVYRFRLLDGHG